MKPLLVERGICWQLVNKRASNIIMIPLGRVARIPDSPGLCFSPNCRGFNIMLMSLEKCPDVRDAHHVSSDTHKARGLELSSPRGGKGGVGEREKLSSDSGIERARLGC